ncbi:transcriptional regulator [Streptomyces sp. FIT100]|uniref:transcriptional regulator n=1 Tax=Streptomyces sp. FIT100 TaxID=2837956 RepID=UPI0021C6D9B2|nr:transcriptional regulator [Streptomyces sp. FIT100]UUN25430.1 transcriptional regulator [Streptomyces sp. FIT100]
MSETFHGRTICDPDDRCRRLATALTDLVPEAARIRVTQQAPTESWPHPHARAYDSDGCLIELKRAQVYTVARWIMRAHPEALWKEAHDFDLASAELTPTVPGAGHLKSVGQAC